MDSMSINSAITPTCTSLEPLVLNSLSHPSLAHLPIEKRQPLLHAVEVILDTMKSARPCMLVLFGSYARGNWQETPQYQSHFDVLAVMRNGACARKVQRKASLYQRLKREVTTPVHLVAENIHFINQEIRKGVYFYTDMVRDGLVLFDSRKYELVQPMVRSFTERKQQAQTDFDHWFGKAMTFKKGFTLYLHEQDYSEAAFHLHQIAERLYEAFLLVFCRYKPSSHDLARLGQYVASIEPRFLRVFPQTTPEDKAKFELLRQAYVDARYQPSFSITPHDLAWLSRRVRYLQRLTQHYCHAKIASY